MKIINITKVALLAIASLMLMPAQADYPDKPIGVMVAYGPGGAQTSKLESQHLRLAKRILLVSRSIFLISLVLVVERVGTGLPVKPHRMDIC